MIRNPPNCICIQNCLNTLTGVYDTVKRLLYKKAAMATYEGAVKPSKDDLSKWGWSKWSGGREGGSGYNEALEIHSANEHES